MKISVAMTVYNGEKYLAEQLDSIRCQTRQADEVVICDDISGDSSAELIRGYIEKYGLSGSWFFSVNDRNKGYASNFFDAVEKTTGELVFFCDQDDIWLPDRLERMERVMEEHADIQMLGSEFEPFCCSEDAPTIRREVLESFHNDGSLEHVPFTAANVFIGSEGCTMCIRKSFWEQIREYWFPGWAHDEFVWKLSLCLDGCYIYHKTTLKRRMHAGNVSKRKMRDLQKRIVFFETLEKSHEHTLQFAKKLALQQETLRLLERNIKATQMRVSLMRDRKLYLIFPLAFCYADCYHSKKSIPVEFMMAIKG